jgi:hypothetical protein
MCRKEDEKFRLKVRNALRRCLAGVDFDEGEVNFPKNNYDHMPDRHPSKFKKRA